MKSWLSIKKTSLNALRRWQTRKHCCSWHFLARANWETFDADTKCFWTKSERFFGSRTENSCPQQMLRARANEETFVLATMCPQQCVLVCQGLYVQCKFDYYRVNANGTTWIGRTTQRFTNEKPRLKKRLMHLNKYIKFSAKQTSPYFSSCNLRIICLCEVKSAFRSHHVVRWRISCILLISLIHPHVFFFSSRKAWNQQALNRWVRELVLQRFFTVLSLLYC